MPDSNNTQRPFQTRILIQIIFIIGTCFLLGQMISAVLFLNSGITEIASIDPDNPQQIAMFKAAHFFSSFLSFVVPALLIAWLVYRNPWRRLMLVGKLDIVWFIVPLICLFVALPWLNYLIQWNESIRFPDAWSGLYDSFRQSEDLAKHMTDIMLTGNTATGLFLNILLIALLPALGEELLFRGVIQSFLKDATRNAHIAIWLTALIFSAIHFQFFGFFARLILGAFFGYLVLWSGSLWPAIAAHFFNNALAVVAHYYMEQGLITEQTAEFGSQASDLGFSLISLILTIVLLRFLFRKYKCKL